MHNIKEEHDIKASVGDTFVDYGEAFKKTRRAKKIIILFYFILFFSNSKCRKKKLPNPIIFVFLFILMGYVLDLSTY